MRSVRVGAADEKRFFDQFGPLYIAPADLAEIQRRIQARKSWEARRKLDILFDDEPAPPLDFSDLQQKYRRQLPGTAGTEARFSNTDAAVSVLLIEGTEQTARLAGARQLVSRVEADLRALGGPQHYAPGMRVGLAGNVAVSVEELQALSEDLGISTVIVVSTVLAVILLFFGWWIAIPALLIPLAIGTVAAFGLAAALPLGIDRLNSSTAFLGSIVVGNGVNFGIVWLARYAEARRRAVPVEPALAQAIAGALPGHAGRRARRRDVVRIAGGDAVPRLSPVRVHRRHRHADRVGVDVPADAAAGGLARAARRPRPLAGARAPSGGAAKSGPSRACSQRHAVLIVVVAGALTVGAGIEISRFDSSRIESDFSRLRRRDTGTLGRRLLGPQDGGGAAAQPVADGDPRRFGRRCARRSPRACAATSRSRGWRELIAQVRDIDDVVPPDQPGRIAEIERIRGMITPVVRAQLSPESVRLVDRLLGQGALQPVQLADVPPSLTAGLRERDGTLGRTVLVFPQLTKRLWQTDELGVSGRRACARRRPTAWRRARRPARVAGYVPIASDITRALQRDGPIASAIAFARSRCW